MKRTLLLLALLAATALPAAEPDPLAWTQETPVTPSLHEEHEWRVEVASSFAGPWSPAPVVLPPGKLPAGYMAELIVQIRDMELEDAEPGSLPRVRLFRFIRLD